MSNKRKGWRNESIRHSLASKGIETSHSKGQEVPTKNPDDIDMDEMVGLGVGNASIYFVEWIDDLDIDGLYRIPGYGGGIVDLVGEPKKMKELLEKYREDRDELMANAKEHYKMTGDDSVLEWFDAFDDRLEHAIEHQSDLKVEGKKFNMKDVNGNPLEKRDYVKMKKTGRRAPEGQIVEIPDDKEKVKVKWKDKNVNKFSWHKPEDLKCNS